MRTIRVNVTQRAIDRGEPGNPYQCPIGIAIDVVLPCPKGMHAISTAIGTTRAKGKQFGAIIDGQWCTYPPHVTDWVIAYDAGERVEPIAFNLEIPDAPRSGVALATG